MHFGLLKRFFPAKIIPSKNYKAIKTSFLRATDLCSTGCSSNSAKKSAPPYFDTILWWLLSVIKRSLATVRLFRSSADYTVQELIRPLQSPPSPRSLLLGTQHFRDRSNLCDPERRFQNNSQSLAAEMRQVVEVLSISIWAQL